MRFPVRVEVRLRPGIADPQGAVLERALPALGFTSISGLKVGKSFRFDVEASDAKTASRLAEEMAQRLLANPVLEEAEVHLDQAR
ncbi:MAG: phosphoribosylformylglycinamidine synthase subunit PurS [Actinobacteria bacterium]|nr:phosphoribosylformylglycinamidine synthase subunit PurS [Actinomycetota bacterium]